MKIEWKEIVSNFKYFFVWKVFQSVDYTISLFKKINEIDSNGIYLNNPFILNFDNFIKTWINEYINENFTKYFV